LAETFRIEIPIEVQDKTEPGISRATQKMNGFDRANQRTQERLNKMNRTKYQVVLDALDKASMVVGRVSTNVRGIAGKTFTFTMKVFDIATAPLRGIWNMVTSIQGAILGATGAFAGIYKPMEIAGDYEETQIPFVTMLKSAEKAEKFLEDASDFANKTPFEFPELINSSKLLLEFGFQSEKILDLMTTIGDTASGLGAGSEGIDRITRALGQMQAKGRAQAEELLQLQELGVPANQILQEELGLTGEQVANIGNESIEAAKVIDALLRGMDKRFGGMMQKQSQTAKGMISTLTDTLKNRLLRPWGQGLWEGIKPGLSKITTWLDENGDTVAAWGEAWKEAGANISKWVMEKVEALQDSIRRMVNSQEWKDAKTFGEKMKIAWDKIIAEPFSEWWNGTGKQYFIDKATSIGQGIGSGIRMGLLALLGIDVSETFNEGQSVGAGFLAGFKKGFDTEQITEALKEWASNNKEVVAVLGVVLGGKLIGGIYKGVKEAKSLVTDIKNIFSKGSGNTVPGATPSAYTTTTMTVTANVVNVYGNAINNAGSAVKDIVTTVGGSAGGAALGAGGAKALLTAGGAAAAGTPLLLPGAAGGGAAAATGLTAAGSWLSKLLTMGSTSSVIGADGTLLAVQGGLGGTLGSVGGALGSTATTAAGAAAAGAAGAGGIIGGILGLGSAAIDLFQGIGKGKAGDTKGAKDEYVTSGTKAGMVAAGAGTGALIGSVVPGIGTAIGALVGAGVGGIGALFGGDKAGKALSDASDPGGWLSNSGKAIGDFFTKTLPKGWNSFWSGVGGFFTTTIPKWWGNLTDGISTFFTETLPEKWTEFWEGVGDFFTETIPYAIGYAVGKAETFFTQDIPAFFGNLWGGIKTFFTSTLPTWASNIWNGHIVPFFAQDIPAFFSGIWNGIKTFFTSTLPTWASDTWNNSIVPFFTQDIPNFFGGLWSGITTFFTSTLPTWATNVWNNNILPFFTQTIPQFFTDLWNSITGFFTETLPTIASSIWGSIKGFFTDTIPNFFKDVWGSITGFFSAGYSDAKSGAGYQPHAHGGIFAQPHMGLVAEAGAESIIPLSPSRRTRGIDLWRETGELLGVRPYANGGIIGAIRDDGGDVPVAAGNSGSGVTIKIDVSANPEFTIGTGNAGDDEQILSVLKAHIRSMADDIGDELAERLARIFVNMPVKA
jgi:tape measure domain-containing protein